jgi:hypothetical protein
VDYLGAGRLDVNFRHVLIDTSLLVVLGYMTASFEDLEFGLKR